MKCIFYKKECIRKNNNVCSECSTSGKEYNNNINKMNELTEEQKITMQKFADKTKDNPKEIIDWAENEIKAYQELIRILKKQ